MSKEHPDGWRPGRPPLPADERRSRHIGVRFSSTEWRRIAAHAARAGERPSVFVRASTLALIAQGGQLPVPPSRAGAERRRELRAIGVLLAEIGTYVNNGGAEIAPLLVELETWIVSQVRAR